MEVSCTAQEQGTFAVQVVGKQRLVHSGTAVQLKLLMGADGRSVLAALEGAYLPQASAPPRPLPELHVHLEEQCQPAALHLDRPESCKWAVHSVVPRSDASFVRTATLVNTTRNALSFRLSTDGPFKLCSAVCSVIPVPRALRKSSWGPSGAAPGSLQVPGSAEVQLPPSQSVDVQLQLRAAQAPDCADCELTGALLVHFSNGEVQSFPLSAQLKHPRLSLPGARSGSVDQLDFGRVHMRSSRTLPLLLANATQVQAQWHIQQPAGNGVSAALGVRSVPASKSAAFAAAKAAEASAFTAAPAAGCIPGHGVGLAQEQTVAVTFAPRRAGAFEQVLTLKLEGGRDCSVLVRGFGSLDEQDEPVHHLAKLTQ